MPSTPYSDGALPNLDYLRATAVLLVCLDHFLLAIPGFDKVLRVPPPFVGEAGVMIFFTHTSLVLMQSMERMALRGSALWISFMIRRGFRIYPLSIATILLVTVLQIPPFVGPNQWEWVGVKALVANLALIQNVVHAPNVVAPLWSLPYEVQMYMVLPTIFLAIAAHRTRRALLILTLSIAFLLPLFLLRDKQYLTWLVGLSSLQFVPCFLSGILAYKSLKEKTPRLSSHLWWIFVPAAVAAYALIRTWLRSHSNGYSSWMSGFTAEMICAWMLCLLIGAALPYFRQSNSVPVNRGSQVIAQYSYGAYMGHVPIMWFSFERLSNQPGVIQAAVFVVLMIAVPVIAYHLLEAPLIRLGKHLSRVSQP